LVLAGDFLDRGHQTATDSAPPGIGRHAHALNLSSMVGVRRTAEDELRHPA
jgi:hypothetical protein